MLAKVFGIRDLQDRAATKAAASEVAKAKDSPPSARPNQIGGAGTAIWAGDIVDLDPNTALRGALWYGQPSKLGICDEMMRDPHVRRSVSYIYSPLLGANWCMKPASSEPIDREVADYARYAIIESVKWDRFLKQCVTDYGKAGFSLWEMTDDFRRIPAARFPLHPGGGAGVVVTGMNHRKPSTLWQWHQSKTHPEQIEAISQFVQGSDVEQTRLQRIPADRLLRFTWDQEGADFDGFAPLRSVYQPWKIKRLLVAINSIRHERLAIPVPTVVAPETASEADMAAVETLLAELRANEKSYLLLPSGFTVSFEGITQSDGTDLGAEIERCNRDIAYNVSAGHMMLGLSTASGSFALAESQAGQYHLESEGHARFVESVFNQGSDGWTPIERIVRLNYGPDVALPRLEARHLPTRNWESVVKMLNDSVRSGLIVADDALEQEARDALMVGPADVETRRYTEAKAEVADV